MQTMGRFPGVAGIFIASILSASLSTISSGMNSMATVIIEDIYKRLSNASSMTNESQAIALKILCKVLCLDFLLLRFFVNYSSCNWSFHHISRIHRVLYQKQYYNS